VILVTIFFVPQLAFATDLKARVLECATTEDGIKRFSCYEDIGIELLKLEGNQVGEVEDDEPKSSSKETVLVEQKVRDNVDAQSSMPSELGGRQFDKRIDGSKKSSRVLAKARITSCKKAIDGKWFFIFENGQVWKQVGSSRRNYRKCDFLTTIKKDGIGFKMEIEGEKRSLRIKRYR